MYQEKLSVVSHEHKPCVCYHAFRGDKFIVASYYQREISAFVALS